MNEIMINSNDLMISALNDNLSNCLVINELQDKLDIAERDKRVQFEDFSDMEMMQWFIHRREHLSSEHNKSPLTKKEYQKELTFFIKHLLEYANEINLDMTNVVEGSLFKSLEPRHIRRYQEWLATESPYVKKQQAKAANEEDKQKAGYSKATLARKTTVLRNFFRFLYEAKYTEQPLHKDLLKTVVKTDDRPNRDLGASEVVQLLNYFKEINHPIMYGFIHVLVTTGIRNEELCKLSVGDLRYDATNSQYYLIVDGKGNKKRQIPLKMKVIDSINEFRKARGLAEWKDADKTSPLFTTSTGKSYTPSYLAQYLSKQIQNTNLPFVLESNRTSVITTHTLRHSFAIISYISKVDLYQIMRSLGHERIETTTIYLQKAMERDQHAIHQWDNDLLAGHI